MGSKYSDDYFAKRCEAEPRMTELSDEAAIRLLEGMINSCRLDSDGDEFTFYLLVNDILRNYSLTLKDLFETPQTREMPKDPNGYSIDYDSLLTNRCNFDWKEELYDYLDCGLLKGRTVFFSRGINKPPNRRNK